MIVIESVVKKKLKSDVNIKLVHYIVLYAFFVGHC